MENLKNVPWPSISFVIPVYDDFGFKNLLATVEEIRNELAPLGFTDYEILPYCCRHIGEAVSFGVKNSSKEYVGIYSAYNQIRPASLRFIIPELGMVDIVIGFIGNPESRPRFRQFLSGLNTGILNKIFRLNLDYYHFCFFRTEMVRKVKTYSLSHAVMAEVAVWLVKSGATYTHVPIYLKPHDFPSKSGAFKLTNIARIFIAYLRLFFLVTILRKRVALRPNLV